MHAAALVDFTWTQLIVNALLALVDVKHVILQLHVSHAMFLSSYKIIAVYLDVGQVIINQDLLALDVLKDVPHVTANLFVKSAVQED